MDKKIQDAINPKLWRELTNVGKILQTAKEPNNYFNLRKKQLRLKEAFKILPMPKLKIRPKKWYQWLNPFWWMNKKLTEKFLNKVVAMDEFQEEQKRQFFNEFVYGNFVHLEVDSKVQDAENKKRNFQIDNLKINESPNL